MASVMEAFNASSTPFASTIEATIGAAPTGVMNKIVEGANGWSIFFTLVALAVVYDQISYRNQKGALVGPTWKMPFIGPFMESIHPTFEKYHSKWVSGELSCVSVFHKFVVIAATRDMARKVLNSPAYVKPCIVDVATKLLRPENFVFLHGKAHVEYRKGLNGLFTRQGLESYLPGQQELYREYLDQFVKDSQEATSPQPYVYPLRELMCAVSCRTFVGHYMSHSQVKKIADDYYLITSAMELVNFPIILPFTKAWYGKKASDVVLELFASCSAKAKVRMRQKGAEPECLLDRWVHQMIESERYRARIAKGEAVPEEEKPVNIIRDFTDFEVAMTLFAFLFASQDATSSACSWMTQLVIDRPEMLAKVREEAQRIRPDRNSDVSLSMLEQMEYTRACVKETLRYRPPVLMIPYEVKHPFPVTDTYTARPGTMIIPSFFLSLHDPDVYKQPDEYAPDRWITGDAEAQTKNWLVFGSGPHYCIGQQYATLNLMLLLHLMMSEYDVEHHVTDQSEDIRVFATIFPMDDLLLTFKKRSA